MIDLGSLFLGFILGAVIAVFVVIALMIAFVREVGRGG